MMSRLASALLMVVLAVAQAVACYVPGEASRFHSFGKERLMLLVGLANPFA